MYKRYVVGVSYMLLKLLIKKPNKSLLKLDHKEFFTIIDKTTRSKYK